MANHWLSEIRGLARGVWSNLSPEKGDMATAPREATSANKHVDEFLSYYVALPHPPKYAVLVNGPWGIGKTYLVIEFLRRAFPVTDDQQRPRPVYVSLYGLSSLSEIDNALLRAMYPLLGYKATKIGGRVTQALLAAKVVNLNLNLNLTDILDKSGAALYVFDDLERCVADLNSVLGYINQFVEHHDRKVIIIANDAEIFSGSDKEAERKRYEHTREKLIGKILEVQPAFGEAFSYFSSLVDTDRVKALFLQNEKEIEAIYTQSKLNNLRILQQTMWDFERFSGALAEKHWKNAEALKTL
jgi:hypothetical protein